MNPFSPPQGDILNRFMHGAIDASQAAHELKQLPADGSLQFFAWAPVDFPRQVVVAKFAELKRALEDYDQGPAA